MLGENELILPVVRRISVIFQYFMVIRQKNTFSDVEFALKEIHLKKEFHKSSRNLLNLN